MRQTQRSPEGPRHLHRIPRLSEAPWARGSSQARDRTLASYGLCIGIHVRCCDVVGQRLWHRGLLLPAHSYVPPVGTQPPQVTLSLSWVEGALTRMGTLIPAGAPWDLLDNPELVWPPWGLSKGPAVPGWKKQMLRLAKNSRPCSQADAMKPRIISKINRQVVPPVRAILALGGCEGHPVGGRGMFSYCVYLESDCARTRGPETPTPLSSLLGREPVDLALISRSVSFTLCVLGHDTHLSGPPRPCL